MRGRMLRSTTPIKITPMSQLHTEELRPDGDPIFTTWEEFKHHNKDGMSTMEFIQIEHLLDMGEYALIGGGAEALVRIELAGYTFDSLTAEYCAWMDRHCLTLGSADEHLFDETLSVEQRAWLREFSQRWERLEIFGDGE